MQGLSNIYNNITESKQRLAAFLISLGAFIFGFYSLMTNSKKVTENGVEKKVNAGKGWWASILLIFGMAGTVFIAMSPSSGF
jgi:CRISPR/Cas system endoribonuclease Cas6 (RAMP superfamily)